MGYAFLVLFTSVGASEKAGDSLSHIFSCFFCLGTHSQTSEMSAILGIDQTTSEGVIFRKIEESMDFLRSCGGSIL